MSKANKKHNYKKKINKTPYIVFTIILIIILVVILLNKNMNNNHLKNLTTKVYEPFSNLTENISDILKYKEYKKENENLKKLKIEQDTLTAYNKELEKENESLKKLNKLKYEGYELKFAKVITRNKLYWFNELTINLGSKDKVKIGDAIVSENGLIGRISQVSKNTSVVNLITSEVRNKTSIIVETPKGEKTGVITGYKEGFLTAEGMTNYDGVNVGDKVYTSGLGNFPKGIFIGTVEKQENNNYETSNIIYIKSNQNLENIYLVGVLTSK